jgi:hypothetical protein
MRLAPWHAAALVVLDFLLTALLIWPMGDWLGGVTVG